MYRICGNSKTIVTYNKYQTIIEKNENEIVDDIHFINTINNLNQLIEILIIIINFKIP